MKNSLSDLNTHLFGMLETINDPEIKGEKLQEELQRAKGVTLVANAIINNGKLALDALKLSSEQSISKVPLFKSLNDGSVQ